MSNILHRNSQWIFIPCVVIFLCMGCRNHPPSSGNMRQRSLVEEFSKEWLDSSRETFVFHDVVARKKYLREGWVFDEDSAQTHFPWPRFTPNGGIVEIQWNQCMERRIGVKLLNINASYPGDLVVMELNGHPLAQMEDSLPMGEYEFYIPSAYQVEGINQLQLGIKPGFFESPQQYEAIGLHSIRITLGAVVKNAVRIGEQVRKSLLFAAPIALKIDYPSKIPHFIQFSYGLYSLQPGENGSRYTLSVTLYESDIAKPGYQKKIPIQVDKEGSSEWRFVKLQLPELDRPGTLELSFQADDNALATDYLALSEIFVKPRQKNWTLRQGNSEVDILFITLSSIATSQLGAYGNPTANTPFLDRLSQHGYLHMDLSSASNGELSAIQSIATGLYPRDHGLYRSVNQIKEGVPVIPEVLQNTIYQSYGFSHSVANDHSPFLRMNGFRRVYLSNPSLEPLSRVQAQFTDAVSSPYLNANPGFYWLHIANQLTPPDAGQPIYGAGLYGPGAIDVTGMNLPASDIDRLQSMFPGTAKTGDVRTLLALNDDRVHDLDRFVCEVTQTLLSKRSKRSIALAVSADHGIIRSPHSNLLSRDSLSHEVLQVPFLAAELPFEGNPVHPVILDKPASTLRLFDFFTGLAQGGNVPSMAAVFSSGIATQRIPATAIFSEHNSRPIVAFRKGDLKLIHCLSDPYFQVATTSLFNLKDDPSESVNLVGRDPAATRQLLEPVMAFCRASDRYPKPRPGLEDEVLQVLKALDYTSGTILRE